MKQDLLLKKKRIKMYFIFCMYLLISTINIPGDQVIIMLGNVIILSHTHYSETNRYHTMQVFVPQNPPLTTTSEPELPFVLPPSEKERLSFSSDLRRASLSSPSNSSNQFSDQVCSYILARSSVFNLG